MKKITLFVVFCCILFQGVQLCAQSVDCREIVLPMVHYDQQKLDRYPQQKLEWFCHFSQNSFFFADTLAEGAPVYDINALRHADNGKPVSSLFVPDLNTLSFWAFNFKEFNHRHSGERVYFRLNDGSHAYLVLRPYEEALRLTNAKE